MRNLSGGHRLHCRLVRSMPRHRPTVRRTRQEVHSGRLPEGGRGRSEGSHRGLRGRGDADLPLRQERGDGGDRRRCQEGEPPGPDREALRRGRACCVERMETSTARGGGGCLVVFSLGLSALWLGGRLL